MKKTEAAKMKNAEVIHPAPYVKRMIHRSERRKAKKDIRQEAGETGKDTPCP